MVSSNTRAFTQNAQVPPIVSELQAIFDQLDDSALIEKLKGPTRRGPKGHNPEILWHCYVAYYYMGLESVSALIRILYDNPFIAQTCGINSPDEIPSQPTFSRFGAKLAYKWVALEVKNVIRNLTCKLYETLPDFGKSVAIDSTDIKAWSNPGKKGKKRRMKGLRRRPARPGEVSDPEAGWIIKTDTKGKNKIVWGYKVHILCDTTYELPLAIKVTSGNTADVTQAGPLLRQARFTYTSFYPKYVMCDAGYSSDPLRRLIRRQYRAEPIIDPNPAHKKAYARTKKTPEWKALYRRRGAIERLNGRLKDHRKLDDVRVRGLMKVSLHAMMSTIVCQAQALATQSRICVRKVA